MHERIRPGADSNMRQCDRVKGLPVGLQPTKALKGLEGPYGPSKSTEGPYKDLKGFMKTLRALSGS